MTFTYFSDDLTTTLNQVRRLIGDVNSTSAEFQDAEINFFIDQEANIFGAASLASEALAAKYADQVDKEVDDLKIRASQKHAHYEALSTKYRATSKVKGSPQVFAGGISKAQKLTEQQDTDRVEPDFSRDQFEYDGTNTSSTR